MNHVRYATRFGARITDAGRVLAPWLLVAVDDDPGNRLPEIFPASQQSFEEIGLAAVQHFAEEGLFGTEVSVDQGGRGTCGGGNVTEANVLIGAFGKEVAGGIENGLPGCLATAPHAAPAWGFALRFRLGHAKGIQVLTNSRNTNNVYERLHIDV